MTTIGGRTKKLIRQRGKWIFESGGQKPEGRQTNEYIMKKEWEDYEKRKKKKEEREEKYIMEALHLLIYRHKRLSIINNIKKNNKGKIHANKVYRALKGYLDVLDMDLIFISFIKSMSNTSKYMQIKYIEH